MVRCTGVARLAAVAGCIAILAVAGADDAWARKKKKAQPVQAAPAVPQIAIPQRPYPPDGASAVFVLPARGADGLFVSPNRNISPSQMVWNLRSAYNVAALNCAEPQRGEITTGYKTFLRSHSRVLATANRTVDAEFRKQHGVRYVAPRERYMTHVYNHFAFPPTLPAFCNAVLAMSREVKPVKSAQLQAYSARALPSIEIVFDDFRNRYARYQADLAEWDRQYLALYVQRYGVPPGGIAVQTAAQGASQIPAR